MKESFEKLQKHLEKASALGVAMNLFYWDGDTLAPAESSEYTAKVLAILSGEQFDTLVGDETRRLLAECEKEQDLSLEEEAILRILHRQFEQLEKLPRMSMQSSRNSPPKGMWSGEKRKRKMITRFLRPSSSRFWIFPSGLQLFVPQRARHPTMSC